MDYIGEKNPKLQGQVPFSRREFRISSWFRGSRVIWCMVYGLVYGMQNLQLSKGMTGKSKDSAMQVEGDDLCGYRSKSGLGLNKSRVLKPKP